jgi:uncharacterized membrane protein
MALTSENGKTHGTIDTDVKLSGKAAAMGGGVIKEVSGKLVDQFAKNLAEMLGAGGPAAGQPAQPTPEAAAAAGPATPSAPAAAAPATPTSSTPDAPAQPTPAAAEAAGPATPTAQPRAAQPPAEADALDVGNLVGPMIASRLRDPKVLGAFGLLLALLVLLKRRS